MTVDDDLLKKLKALAHRRNISLKEAINGVLRRGLAFQDLEIETEPFEVEVFKSRARPGVDLEKLNSLSDEIEVRHATDNPLR
jgi:hypothetical protein